MEFRPGIIDHAENPLCACSIVDIVAKRLAAMRGDITLVIPAAGEGRRLSRPASSTPKALLSLQGRPLLEYVLDVGLLSPIARIVIVIGPSSSAIQRHLGSSWKDVPIEYAVQDRPLGLADAVSRAEPFVDEWMLIINADEIFVGGRCHRVTAFLREKRADGVVGYVRTTPGDPRVRSGYGLELAPNGRVRGLVEKPVAGWNDLLGVGFWLLGRDYFRAFPATPWGLARRQCDLVDVIQTLVDEGRAIYGMNLGGAFVNVNTWDDVRAAERVVRESLAVPSMVRSASEMTSCA